MRIVVPDVPAATELAERLVAVFGTEQISLGGGGEVDVVVDPESREVINRENDVRAHAHEREHPDQALLRYRAYRPARSESDNTVSIEPHANIKA